MEKIILDLINGIELSPDLEERQISRIPDSIQKDMGNGYVWYYLVNRPIKSETVSFSLCFYQQKLFSLSFALSNKQRYGFGWEDFSEEKEKLRAFDTEKWLIQNNFILTLKSWGQFWVGYDAKSGAGKAILRCGNAI
jgi:hypothetical protein